MADTFDFKRFTPEELAAMTPAEHDAYFRPLTGEEIPPELREKISAMAPPPRTERRAG